MARAGVALIKVHEINDAWRHVDEWNSSERPILGEISLDESEYFPATSLTLEKGIYALCGRNAVGKTYFLRKLFQRAASVESDKSDSRAVYYADISSLIRRCVDAVQVENIDDLLTSSEFGQFKPKEVRLVEYLLGHNYKTIEFAEMDNTQTTSSLLIGGGENSRTTGVGAVKDPNPEIEFSPEVAPYFRVVRGSSATGEDIELDASTLSRGELAALTLVWVYKNVDSGSILFIDEPEVYLAPDASGRVLDTIAWLCDSKRVQTVVATHAAFALGKLPANLYSIIEWDASGKSRLAPGADHALWARMRIPSPNRIIFVVEDVASGELLKRILIHLEFKYLHASSFWVAGSDDAVFRASRFPVIEAATADIIAVAEGDVRKNYTESWLKKNTGPRLAILPIQENLEKFLLGRLVDWAADHGSPTENLARDALGDTSGMNSHDRLGSIAEKLSLSSSALRVQIIDYLLKMDAITEEVVAFKDALLKVIKSSGTPWIKGLSAGDLFSV